MGHFLDLLHFVQALGGAEDLGVLPNQLHQLQELDHIVQMANGLLKEVFHLILKRIQKFQMPRYLHVPSLERMASGALSPEKSIENYLSKKVMSS